MSDAPSSGRPFKAAFRGYDQDEVDQYLTQLELKLEKTREHQEALAARLEQLGEKKHDFDALGAELSQMLNLAQEAADGMRKRATDEVALWRAEARAEVDHAVRSSTDDSEAMRADAWRAAEQLLNQAQSEAERILAEAQREALALTGQAERDAHRLGSNAKRDAEEQMKLAKVEAERILTEARAERDQIVDLARKAADQAQERARALEIRRNDLLTELESVRSTVSRLESDLEEKRQALSAVPAADRLDDELEPAEAGEPAEDELADVEAAPPTEQGRTKWAKDSIRIIPAATADEDKPVDATEMADEARLRNSEAAAEAEGAVSEEEDGLTDLFAELTSGDAEDGEIVLEHEAFDGFALRDQLLLPITNRILRSVKRQLTDSQNVALEALGEAGEGWTPDVTDVEKALHGDFVILAQESFAAGYAGVETMTGESLGRPKPEASEVIEQTGAFTAALEESLVAAIADADSERASSSAVSRTYRVWRTDEAERRIRSYARLGYHKGVARGLYALGMTNMEWVLGSPTCEICAAEAEKSPMEIATHLRKDIPVPPIHPDCSCTLVPA